MQKEEIEQQFAAMAAKWPELQIPPNVLTDMEAEFVAYEAKKSLTIRFPVLERYQNPMGMMQGGVIVAAIDNVLGPLSYMAAPPSVTTQLNTSYLRPISPKDKWIEITAEITEISGRHLFMQATVRNEQQKTVAIAYSTNMIQRARRA